MIKLFITRVAIVLIFLLIAGRDQTAAQIEPLRQQIGQILRSKKAIVGVAISGPEDHDTLTFNDTRHYPMQSVYKFHLALRVLSLVDKGELSLNQAVHLTKADLLPDTWSPLRKKYPEGNVDIPLSELLFYTVSRSDNNGCDILFRLTGGTEKTNQHIHSLGITAVSIAATEEEMHRNRDVQHTNWSTPSAAVQLLKKFYQTDILSPDSRRFLWSLMSRATTGSNKIKGLLPAEAIVAHKSGLSFTNKQGVTAASNDIGIVQLPDGRHFVLAVFVSDSKEEEATNEKIIAEIAKAAWDYFSKKQAD